MKNYLYDIFADKWVRKNGSIYIYSDPHFSDLDSYMFRDIIHCITREQFEELGIQNFSYDDFLNIAVKHADEMQIKNINKVCGKNDTLIILGDVGNVECVKKLKARYKILILGNHDKGASNYKRHYEEEFDHTGQYEDNPEEFKQMRKDGWVIEDEHFTEYYSDSYAVIDAVLWKKVEDNHLFDEVYEGPLMINDRVILSHEPIPMTTYMFNIHGHIHKEVPFTTEFHLNVCAEHINYTPINLLRLFKQGLLSDVENIHRVTIDTAVERKRGNDDGSK